MLDSLQSFNPMQLLVAGANYIGQRNINDKQIDLAKDQMAFQERMSSPDSKQDVTANHTAI